MDIKKDNDFADLVFAKHINLCHAAISVLHAKIATLTYLKKQLDDKKRMKELDVQKEFEKPLRHAAKPLEAIKKEAWPHL